MKVSRSAAYALHALMYMVRHATQLPVAAAVVAKAEGVPSGYLAKIFRQLVNAGFVAAVSGKKRGYVFARSPEEITVLELLEAIEGRPLFDECLLRHCECGGTLENCRVFSTWVDATRGVGGRRLRQVERVDPRRVSTVVGVVGADFRNG